jgi:hypothetical protein
MRGKVVPLEAGRPLRLVIFSNLAEPPALIFASRRSRLRRAASCAGDSPAVDMLESSCCLDLSSNLAWMVFFNLYGRSLKVGVAPVEDIDLRVVFVRCQLLTKSWL